MVSDTVSPGNALRPVSISNRTEPNAQISVRLSTVFPRACSGLMYAAVPRIVPGREAVIIVGEFDRFAPAVSTSHILASPKSSTLT